MTRREEITDINSCFNRANNDEMLFILMGRDIAAPGTVLSWVLERVRLGKNKMSDPQILEALAWADKITKQQEAKATAKS